VDPVNPESAVREIERRPLNGRQIAVATVNSEVRCAAMENEDFRQALCAVDLMCRQLWCEAALEWRESEDPRCTGVDLDDRGWRHEGFSVFLLEARRR